MLNMTSEFAKLHMGLVVLVKKMSVLINFLLQDTNLVSVLNSLAKSAQMLLVMSDRTDTLRELCYIMQYAKCDMFR